MIMTVDGDAPPFEDTLRRDDLFWGGYQLWQNPEWFCFGDDSVLLADFAAVRPHDRLLDLGCGNGILLLLLRAREPSLHLCGLEISPENARLARYNLTYNRIEGKIICGDIRNCTLRFPPHSLDHIVMNPPYRPRGSGRRCQNPVRALAREESTCTLWQAVEQAALLLKNDGRLSVVLPHARGDELQTAAENAGLGLGRYRAVSPKTNAPAHLLLAEFFRHATPQPLKTLALRDQNGQKTAAMERVRRGPERK